MIRLSTKTKWKMSCLRSPWTSETVQSCSYSLKLWVCLRPVNCCSSAMQTSCCTPSLVVPKMAMTVTSFQHEDWDYFSLHHSTPLTFCLVIKPPAQSSQISVTAWHWLKDHPLLNVPPPKLRSSYSEITHPKVCNSSRLFGSKSLLTIPYIKTLTHKGKENKSVSSMRDA